MQEQTTDRPARDALASFIADHLHGVIRTTAAHERSRENPLLLDTADPDILALSEAVAAVCEDMIAAPEAIGPATRGWLARVAIFLRSDLRLRRVDRYDYHPRQLAAAAGVGLIAVGLAAAIYLETWIPLAVCWLAAGTLAFFWQRLYGHLPPREIAALGRFAPFRSAQQLRAYGQAVRDTDDALWQMASGEAGASPPEAAAPRISVSWFLFGPLYGTLYLPTMLRREETAILLVEEEGESTA